MSEEQLQLELTSAREQIASLATERDRLAGELAEANNQTAIFKESRQEWVDCANTERERADKAEQARIHVAKAAGGYLDRAERAEAKLCAAIERWNTAGWDLRKECDSQQRQITTLTQERERGKAAAEVDHERITQLEAENATLRLEAIPTRQHSDESWRRRVAKLEAALVAIRPFVGQDQNMDSRDVELCSAAEGLVDDALAAPIAHEAKP